LFLTRTGSGIQSQVVLKNDVAQNSLYFVDSDSARTYVQRTTANGLRMDWLDGSGPPFRIDMSIRTDTGNIGLGQTNPQEKLDVNGNIFLSGANAKILSNGDICIGAC